MIYIAIIITIHLRPALANGIANITKGIAQLHEQKHFAMFVCTLIIVTTQRKIYIIIIITITVQNPYIEYTRTFLL